MITDQNAWTVIQSELASTQDANLQRLLSSVQFEFDGDYVITADASVYYPLCQYFPLIETIIQDVSGKHFRLNLASVPMGTAEGTLSVELGASNLTEAIISPESIAAVPSYLLRYVPYVGSGAILIATALRQAFYRASRDHGADQLYPKSGDSVKIDVESLLSLLGNVISRATFFRIFKEGGLDWFVRRAEPVHRFVDGRITRQANTYTYRGMVLTPGDASDLYQWLSANSILSDPVGVITRAIDTPRDQILSFPYRTPSSSEEVLFSHPASVHEILQGLLDHKRLNPVLAGLCDRLASHLIHPESFLAVPWYWFKNVLPELGDDLGVLYLMCKNCCYIDWARGKDRNTFWVQGGLPTLQQWIRSETLPKRIPALVPSSRGRPRQHSIKSDSEYTRNWRDANRHLAGQYLCRIAVRDSKTGTDWQLKIADVQLTARDELIKQAIYAFLMQPPELLNPFSLHQFAMSKVFASLFIKAYALDADKICHFETLVKHGICQFETLSTDDICYFDTLVDTLNCYFETLVSSGICNFETIINILIKIRYSSLFDPYIHLQNTSPAETSTFDEDKVVGLFDHLDWDIDGILSRVNPVLKNRIIRENRGRQFLSWLIYGSLTSSVHSPLSFAVSRTLETDVDAGGAAARLVDQPAELLARRILNAKTRFDSGYLGNSFIEDPLDEDLTSLLQASSDSQKQIQLLQRLIDHLELSKA